MPIALGTGVPFKSKFSGTVVDPGLALLQSATLWLNSAQSVAGEQSVVNQGTGGSALNARYGSTTGVDTNDPLLLTHTGTNYLYLPGTTDNFASTGDSAILDGFADLEIIVRVAPSDWTPVSRTQIVAKRNAGGTTMAYTFGFTSAGLLYCLTDNGTSFFEATSSVATGFTDGDTKWLRVTRVGSTGTIQFFTAADQASVPSSWTQLGTDVATGLTGNLRNSTDPLTISGYTNGVNEPYTGRIFRVIIRNGIGGTAVFDADFTTNTNQSSFTESSSNAATVTINRSSAGRKSAMVTRPVWLFGTDDYMEIADNALLDFDLTDSFTVLAVARSHNTPASYGTLVAKRLGTGVSDFGYWLGHNLTAFQTFVAINATNTSSEAGGTWTGSTAQLLGLLRDVPNDRLKSSIGSTITAGNVDVSTVSMANTAALRIGRDASAGTSYYDGEIYAVAVFRSLLTSTQLGQIATYYGV